MAKNEVGHQFLAKLGKKRLRPGGKIATDWLIQSANFSEQAQVLEVACNMCTTSIELAERFNCQIKGIDLDPVALKKAQKNIEAAQLSHLIEVTQANAMKLPFEDNQFDIVINEAMLTMLSPSAKEKAIKEYYRVLKPGGQLLTHDVSYLDSNLTSIIEELKTTINVNVAPLLVNDWEALFKKVGFSKVESIHGEMSLMSPKGMIKDEGLFNTLKIVKNGLKAENRKQFKNMNHFFNKTGKDLKYIAVCSTK